MGIQEGDERQGADAWQGLIEAYPEKANQLEELSEIEVYSAQFLKAILP